MLEEKFCSELEAFHGFRKISRRCSNLKMRCSINADTMTKEELHQKLETGYKDIEKGQVRKASEFFKRMSEKV